MRFFVGLHQPSDAKHFPSVMISVNRLQRRVSSFAVGDWMLDSGAFTTLQTWGCYPEDAEAYAEHIVRWSKNGNLLCAVAQDYMCEPVMVARTGLSILEHQRLTIQRYDQLLACDTGVYILPVLQGYQPLDYLEHLTAYGKRLQEGMWVGVGSVCKRNGNIRAIEAVLHAVKEVRPDLRLHGFGLKATALQSGLVQHCLHTADSMAWSYAARKQGRNPNDWREAQIFLQAIEAIPAQQLLFLR